MIFEKIRSIGTSSTTGSPGFCEFEQVVYCNDPGVGLKAIISLHSTALGPATGGCRMWNYASEEEALTDVLRLSRGMTYKASISGLNWGGGKSVIIGDPKSGKSRAMLERFGEYVHRLGGNYISAKDVGISSDDLRQMKSKTPHVLGIEGESGSGGDPSPATAWGVYHGMRAAAKHALGANSLSGLKVALQGLGSVAYALIGHLKEDGAQIIGCDIDQGSIERAVKKYGIEVVKADSIYDVPCDIFAPCALGSSISAQTLPRIRAKVIAGAANNQLATEAEGSELLRRGMTYAPDYAINAGGLINIYHESAVPGGYRQKDAMDHVARIGQTIGEILKRADAEKKPPHQIADRIAEERVAQARKSSQTGLR